MSLVRDNLMTRSGYTPYCGGEYSVCRLPRTIFNGEQFECPICEWQSSFPADFIESYKREWELTVDNEQPKEGIK